MFKTAFLILFPLIISGQEATQVAADGPYMVGDIDFNKDTDREGFDSCAETQIIQYFNDSGGLAYDGEKWAIEKAFAQYYKPVYLQQETGLIRIRFIVNCKGETDRFRLIAMDENYNERVFSKAITDQLLNISKNLKGWKIKRIKDKEVYYYQYLIFKMENGLLKEILP